LLYDSLHTYWRNDYHNVENKVGLKGSLGKIWASVYAKNRSFKRDNYYFYYNYDHFSNRVNEYSAGFDARYTLGDSIWIALENEFLVKRDYRLVVTSDTLAPNSNDYRSAFTFKYKLLSFEFSRANISPTILQSNHQSNFYKWDKDLVASLSDVATVNLFKQFKKQRYILAFANSTTVYNPIYFNLEGNSEQTDIKSGYYTLAVGGRYSLGKFNLEPLFRYSQATGGRVLRVPTYWGNAKLFYENRIVKKLLLIQIGIDYFYRFGYNADGYASVYQNFYLQNNFPTNAYSMLDFFVNAQISKARIFMRFSHLNQGFGGNGYFVGPYYSGPRRSLQLGVSWRFFN
jgi:hypothetical protein